MGFLALIRKHRLSHTLYWGVIVFSTRFLISYLDNCLRRTMYDYSEDCFLRTILHIIGVPYHTNKCPRFGGSLVHFSIIIISIRKLREVSSFGR